MKHKSHSPDSPALEPDQSKPQSAMAAMGQNPSITSFDLRRILVPIDFSEGSLRALPFAFSMAAKFQAKVILLHVVEPTTTQKHFLTIPLGGEEANENLVQSARERLSDLAREKGIESATEALVRLGHAHSEIPDTAKALGADLIIVGTADQVGAQPASLGGVAERLARHAPCPVVIIH